MNNRPLPFPAAPLCATARVTFVSYSARGQMDKLKDFKKDMELVMNWMKKLDEKVDDIAAILVGAYRAAAPDDGISTRALPPDERGRHDPYAEPHSPALSHAPHEPLMDSDLRQQRHPDEERYQQHSQYYHVSAGRCTQMLYPYTPTVESYGCGFYFHIKNDCKV